jgi:hypothetical protein
LEGLEGGPVRSALHTIASSALVLPAQIPQQTRIIHNTVIRQSHHFPRRV